MCREKKEASCSGCRLRSVFLWSVVVEVVCEAGVCVCTGLLVACAGWRIGEPAGFVLRLGALYCARSLQQRRCAGMCLVACWLVHVHRSTTWALIACCSWCIMVAWGCCRPVARCLLGLCAPTTHVVLASSCSRVPAAGCIFWAGLVGKAGCASLQATLVLVSCRLLLLLSGWAGAVSGCTPVVHVS